MKAYENISRNYLTRRVPVIIRLDGKAFHTFTRGMAKPFDDVLTQTMQHTMKCLCENIQGCILGYTQSDEITLVLTDYATIKTDAWFGYNIQKMTSVAASMATLAFNQEFVGFHEKWFNESFNNGRVENKRGSCCIKQVSKSTMSNPRDPSTTVTVERRKWIIDDDIPIFTQNREYIESLL